MSSELLGVIKPLTAGAVLSLLLLKWPILRHIQFDAPYLKSLVAATVAELKSSRKQEHPLKASLVIVGAKDWVVNNAPFARDPHPKVVQDRSHTDVCKPSTDSLDPVHHLMQAL
jgi:hypothetical protein